MPSSLNTKKKHAIIERLPQGKDVDSVAILAQDSVVSHDGV